MKSLEALTVPLDRAVAIAKRYERRGVVLGFLLGLVAGLLLSAAFH